jgi:DNA-binding NarL/FixJ family response regulator
VPERSGGPDAQREIPSGAGAPSKPSPLTPRHLEILSRVARGRTNRQVGEDLGISERTVRNHLRAIQHRLATSDRTHAVVMAIGRGWIAIPIEPEGPEDAAPPGTSEVVVNGQA